MIFFQASAAFSLGLERAGMRTVAFCEVDPFCRRVLAKHWPEVPCYDDVRSLSAERLRADGIAVDVICGGFPCQDISVAGKGAGLAGERSGLWVEYARIIREVRPRFVVVENVAALLGRGMGDVLGDLAEIGYDAEWHCIPASYVGAPHERDRVWIVAYPHDRQCDGSFEPICTRRDAAGCGGEAVADADGARGEMLGSDGRVGRGALAVGIAKARNSVGDDWIVEPDVGRVAARVSIGLDDCRGRVDEFARALARAKGVATDDAYTGFLRALRRYGEIAAASPQLRRPSRVRDPLHDVSLQVAQRRANGVPYEAMRDLWDAISTEPLSEAQDVLKGVLVRDWKAQCNETLGQRAARLRALGNAVVPQVVEVIGRAIMEQYR